MFISSTIGSGRSPKSCRTVSQTIFASSPSDQFSMYQASSSKRCGHGIESRPFTCAQPVMPGLHREPAPVRLRVVRDLLDDVGPRADEAHLAAHDVDELRQLVEARPPQDSGRCA